MPQFTIKALMVDVDDVLINGRPRDGKHWSTDLEADLDLPPPYYKIDFSHLFGMK